MTVRSSRTRSFELGSSALSACAGLEVTGAIHGLRHTFCSILAVEGVPAKAIQELAGHASISTTMKYMHLSPANRAAAIGLLDAAWARPEVGETLERLAKA
jgi:site-specific recombinase XerD